MSEASTATERKRNLRALYSTIALVGTLFTVLALLRLTRFDLTAFDAGIFDNVLWRLGNGYDDVTAITGAHHFSDHGSPLLLLAVPVYSLIPQAGLPMLIILQAVSVVLVAVAVVLLCDHLGLDRERTRAAVLVSLIGAGTYNAALIDIHEVGLALGPLALTAVLAVRNHPLRSYWIWPALAAMARIDLAVSVLIIGLLLRSERPRHSRVVIWIGAVSTGAMAMWLLLNPWEGTSFAFHFGHLGIDAASELPGAVVGNPSAALEPLLDPTMWGTIAIWFVGFMVLPPIRALRWLLPALPTVIIPVFGSWQQADLSHLHYWQVLLPMMAIATVYGLARSADLEKHIFYLAIAGVAATWIFMPIFKPSLSNDTSDYKATVTYLQQQPAAAVASVGPLVPHITHRETVMQLPTPFACPTIPIASFTGPDGAPDLVALPGAIFDHPATAADRAVVKALEDYYERIESFGRLEVWEIVAEVPKEIYSLTCGVVASENS